MATEAIDLTRFFEALETGFPPGGVRSSLDALFGREAAEALERVRVLKVLRMADTYPCPHPGGDGCPRQIVECKDGSYVAVCGNDPPQCDEVKLTAKDVEFLGVVPEKLFEALRTPLRISGAIKRVNGIAQAYRVGAFVPQPGVTHPVYFVAASSSTQYAAALDALRSRADGKSFAMLVPTDKFLSEETVRQFRSLGVPIIVLSDTLHVTASGEFRSTVDFLALFGSIGRRATVTEGEAVYAEVLNASGWQGLTRSAYEQLMATTDRYTILADEHTREIRKKEGKKPLQVRRVNAGHFRMLRKAIEVRGYFDPNVDGLSEDQMSGKQIFQRARQAVDIRYRDSDGKTAWRLFKTDIVDRHSVYRFQPDPGLVFALVFLPRDK